jgi:hypothetical protein
MSLPVQDLTRHTRFDTSAVALDSLAAPEEAIEIA